MNIEDLELAQPEAKPLPVDAPDDSPATDNEDGAHAATADEDRARRMGWVPQDEFRGDPTKWVDATEFNRRGAEQIPLLRSTVRRLEQKLTEQERVAKQFAEFHQRVEKEAYSRALETLRNEKIAARQDFDVAREMEIDDKLAELRHKGPPIAEAPPALDPDYVEWMQENTWAQDREAYAVGTAIGEKLREQGDTSTGRAFLDRIKREMARKYPNLIPGMDNPQRAQPPAVGSSATLPRKGKKTFNDLPADAKAACRDFVGRGYISEEQYIKDYFSGE